MARDGSSQHSPLIHATVGGVDTRLVVDTGSEVHVLTEELSEAVGLTLSHGEEGLDSAGDTVRSSMAGDVPILAGSAGCTLRDVVVIPGPRTFSGWGVGGIVSPQNLWIETWVVIDLIEDELLSIEVGHDDVATWVCQRSPELETMALDRDGTNAVPVVRAAIKRFGDTAAMLDTGASETQFDVAAVPELTAGAYERIRGGIGGADVAALRAGQQTLVVSGVEPPIPQLTVRAEMVHGLSIIGMDVLRGTVVTLNADPRGKVYWQVSPAHM